MGFTHKTFLQRICIFGFVVQCWCAGQARSSLFGGIEVSRRLKNSDYEANHNSCTRKLLCLIAAKNDGKSYDKIRKGK